MFELTRQRLGELADELHIDAVGVATVEPFSELEGHLRRVREKGFESGFEHKKIDERVHPEWLIPNARSIVAIALAYRSEESEAIRRPKGMRGMVSKYAWGLDYHGILRDLLHGLAAAIEREIGRPVCYDTSVDTGPMVDRAVAQRAGIGWFGKHCSIITESHGSWVFLGQIITDVEIEPNEPAIWSDCGDCDLCVRACPTGALDEPYVTDSPRCLSFVTQMKGMVPEPMRAPLGKRIWGCDTCQVVCPKNKDVSLGKTKAFAPEPELVFPELIRLVDISNREFKRLYGHTAMAWRGARVVRRNAILALGNMRDKAAVPKLIELLRDPQPDIRGTVAWALQRIGGEEAREAVAEAAKSETDADVLLEMNWASHQPAMGE